MHTSTKLDPTLTIITPTFNRYATLSRLYESIENQGISIHEWIIIDDGSTDETSALIDKFRSTTHNIRNLIYIYQSNAGKHVALNKGLNRASGEFVCFVDSDDWLPQKSLEAFYEIVHDSDAPLRSDISAISGMKVASNGNLISASTSSNVEIMSHFKWFYLKNRFGDRIDFYKRSAIGDRRFNTFANENFLTEDALWLAIPGLKLFNNTPMLIGDYLPDGLTAQSNRLLAKNPAGSAFYYRTIILQFEKENLPPPLKFYILFFYYSFLSVKSKYALRPFVALVLFPLAALYKKLMRR